MAWPTTQALPAWAGDPRGAEGLRHRRCYLSCPWCWRGAEDAGPDCAPHPRSPSACQPPRPAHSSPRDCPPAAKIHNHRCWSFSGSSRGGSWASPEKRGKKKKNQPGKGRGRGRRDREGCKNNNNNQVPDMTRRGGEEGSGHREGLCRRRPGHSARSRLGHP